MPGTFAHIVLATEATSKIYDSKFPNKLQIALRENQNFVFLGANAPDYPYPARSPKWADRMHCEKSSEIVKSIWDALRIMDRGNDASFAKCFAWFLGYVSHMVGDAVIHPVINIIAGDYYKSLENQKKHWLSEAHQDCYIFWLRMHQQSLGTSEFIKSILINRATRGYDLDSDVSKLWKDALRIAFNDNKDLDPDKWFYRYATAADLISEESDSYVAKVAAKVTGYQELVQIGLEQLNVKFIQRLQTPENFLISYENLFDCAVENTVKLWLTIGENFTSQSQPPEMLNKDWNLDRGETEEILIYWRTKK